MNESGHETADERPAATLTARVVLLCCLSLSPLITEHRATTMPLPSSHATIIKYTPMYVYSDTIGLKGYSYSPF